MKKAFEIYNKHALCIKDYDKLKIFGGMGSTGSKQQLSIEITKCKGAY